MTCSYVHAGPVFSLAGLGESEGVFNHAANLSRLRAQLTVQANKRYIYTCMHETLTTSKLKELQRSKSRCKQLLLTTTTTPNFNVFRCMVPKKWHENVPHTNVWGDGLQNCPIFMTVRQKRLIKVCHFKLNEKRN